VSLSVNSHYIEMSTCLHAAV